MCKLMAYPGGKAQKDALVASLEAHAAADRMVAGHFWRDGTGCSVACALQSLGKIHAAQMGDHAALGEITGYGEMLAMIQEAIFEGLPDGERQQFSIGFHKAIPVGADVSLVGWQFLDRLLIRLFAQPYVASVADACKPARDVISAKARGERVDKQTAYNVSANALVSAASYAAEAVGCQSEYCAAFAAADAAGSAAYAAADAAETAKASFAAAAAEYRAQAADLLELLANAPVPNTEDGK